MLVAVDCVHTVLNGTTILRVKLLHLLELAAVGAVGSDEPGCDCDRLGGVDFEAGSRTPEILSPEAVRLNIATVLVAHTLEAVGPLSPQSVPEHRVWPSVSQACMV